jgi:methylase of polypeptide subunit release factors
MPVGRRFREGGDYYDLPPSMAAGGKSDSGGLEVSDSTFWPKDQRLAQLVLGIVGPVLGDGDRVWELGAGSGVLTKAMAEGTMKSVSYLATELEPAAAADARRNLSGLENVEVREGDMFSALREGELFDVIIWNPPWFGDAQGRSRTDRARVDEGHRELKRFLAGAFGRLRKGGKVYVVLPRNESGELWATGEDLGVDVAEAGTYATKRRIVAIYEMRPQVQGTGPKPPA